MRSKNHLLFELFLEKAESKDLFEKTKHLSLGHIVSFVNKGHEFPAKVADYDDEDFSISSSYKELEKLDEFDITTLSRVIDKIDEYHQNKNQ